MNTVTKENVAQLVADAKQAAYTATQAHLAEHGQNDACGFAWVTIHPARGTLVSYLKKEGIGRKAYQGGWQIWNPSDSHTQAITAKEKGARAYADVLTAAGVKVYAGSRVD